MLPLEKSLGVIKILICHHPGTMNLHDFFGPDQMIYHLTMTKIKTPKSRKLFNLFTKRGYKHNHRSQYSGMKGETCLQ